LEHGQRPLELVVEDPLEVSRWRFDVDQCRLQLLHVHRPGELQVQLVEREQIGQRHGVAHDHHMAPVGADDGGAAHVIGGIGDDRQGERGRRGRIDVLAHLANPAFDLALDWAVSCARRGASQTRLGELLEGIARHPFGVDRSSLPPGS